MTPTAIATESYQPDHDHFPTLDVYDAIVDSTATTLERL